MLYIIFLSFFLQRHDDSSLLSDFRSRLIVSLCQSCMHIFNSPLYIPLHLSPPEMMKTSLKNNKLFFHNRYHIIAIYFSYYFCFICLICFWNVLFFFFSSICLSDNLKNPTVFNFAAPATRKQSAWSHGTTCTIEENISQLPVSFQRDKKIKMTERRWWWERDWGTNRNKNNLPVTRTIRLL